MMPFDPHPECRKCGSPRTTWTWRADWLGGDDLTELGGSVEAIRVICDRCGFAWLMATKEETK